MRPMVRREEILVTEHGSELVLFDEANAHAHRLNASAAAVWRHADGRRTVEQIAGAVAQEMGGQPDQDMVWMGLEGLQKAGLLQSSEDMAQKLARRQLIRRLTVAAVVAPVIMSLPAPAAAQQASPHDNPGGGGGQPV